MPAATLDWTPASRDYALHRPGYPDEIFTLLSLLGVGRPGQAILDLGVGTGHLAIPLARRGAAVTGVDPSPGQLAEARARASAAGVPLALVESIAEEAPLVSGGFDAVTASMCWGYLDARRVVPRVWRALRPGGLLLIASLAWTADDHAVARLTAELLRRHNPSFERRPTPARAPVAPGWAEDRFRLRTWHRETVHLSFTREGGAAVSARASGSVRSSRPPEWPPSTRSSPGRWRHTHPRPSRSLTPSPSISTSGSRERRGALRSPSYADWQIHDSALGYDESRLEGRRARAGSSVRGAVPPAGPAQDQGT